MPLFDFIVNECFLSEEELRHESSQTVNQTQTGDITVEVYRCFTSCLISMLANGPIFKT